MYTLGGFETKLIAEEVGDNFAWDAVPMPKVKTAKIILCIPPVMPC